MSGGGSGVGGVLKGQVGRVVQVWGVGAEGQTLGWGLEREQRAKS